jgi:molybdopterin synthase catalytic subunit
MVTLTHKQIDVTLLLASARHAEAGGVVLFLGTTRKMTAGRRTLTLHYNAYEPMAFAEMQKLHDEACRRWSLVVCHLVHRLGEVPLAEASVAVVTSAAHREAAFNAARWLIDSLKVQVPIWKQEHWADGSTEWVHPGATAQ